MVWYILSFLFLAALAFLLMRYLRQRSPDESPSTDMEEALPGAHRRRDFREFARVAEAESVLPQPAEAYGAHAGASPPTSVSESISVILRRQVPPRDEPARSWLGGLPMLPEDIEWPSGVNPENPDAGEVALHFIAQVCCADLPADLWGGLGPREGWLLLFVNGNSADNEDSGTWRVLHVPELGEEREPPADIGPIHDGIYTGSTGWTVRESSYPRWPVDLVCVPNELRIEEGRSLAAPADFASILYEGQPVAPEGRNSQKFEPFTWRCVVEALDSTIAHLRAPLPPQAERYAQQMRQKLSEPGALEDIVPALERREAEFWQKQGAILNEPEPSDLGPVERDRRANMRAYAATRAAGIQEVAALLAANPTPDALIERLEQEAADEWRAQAANHLQSCRSSLDQEDLDSPITAEDWEGTRQQLTAHDTEIWALAWGHSEGSGLPVTIERRKLSVIEPLGSILSATSVAVATRYYFDPGKRGLIPADMLATLEAGWRRLYENRPHRMGGYHDGLQSDAQPGPAEMLLLMQFATDDPMQWLWGDCGAVYCFIRPGDLEDRTWDRAEFHLECH